MTPKVTAWVAPLVCASIASFFTVPDMVTQLVAGILAWVLGGFLIFVCLRTSWLARLSPDRKNLVMWMLSGFVAFGIWIWPLVR